MWESAARYLDEGRILHRNERSGGLLLRLPDGLAVKMFPSKGAISFLRVPLHRTKADKQARSVGVIRGLGLRTPEVVRVVRFGPGGDFEAGLVYQFLGEARSAREFLAEGGRRELWDPLARDLVVMAKAGVLFVDFHLGNVLVDREGRLWWIDPEVKVSRRLVREKFWQRMRRMYEKCDRDLMTAEDWDYFSGRLREELPPEIREQ